MAGEEEADEEILLDRKKRKEESRQKKKKLIEESGGVRPRKVAKTSNDNESNNHDNGPRNRMNNPRMSSNSKKSTSSHRFGRVMDQTPCRNQPRFSTLSIAVPGSVIANCQTKELRTQMVGQIARAATIYHVDEIVVFDDKLSKKSSGGRSFSRNHRDSRRDQNRGDNSRGDNSPSKDNSTNDSRSHNDESAPSQTFSKFDPHAFFARVLQYCETPQYLRRHFFPMHPDLQFVGLLAPIDAPHHVRADDCCKYREGVVLNKTARGGRGGSLVNCGVPQRPVELATKLQAGIRCTIKLDPSSYKTKGSYLKGEAVSPSAPREDEGTFWGYQVRTADSIKSVLDDCPFEGGYDLKIGTSERGSSDVDKSDFVLPSYKHAIIVFGGVAGIEECVDADESLRLPGSESHKLFDLWINVCRFQGSRTIRTEEAVLITLAKMSPRFMEAESKESREVNENASGDESASNDQEADESFKTNDLSRFDDNSMSEESSEEE